LIPFSTSAAARRASSPDAAATRDESIGAALPRNSRKVYWKASSMRSLTAHERSAADIASQR
jgi:hypothetical protein